MPAKAAASWTGISFKLTNVDTDWAFGSETRESQSSELSFSIEERTDTNLSIGFEIGYFDMRVVAKRNSTAETQKFDGQFLGIYMRQPVRFNDWLSMHGRLSLGYGLGNESGDDEDEDAEIDWTSTAFELGFSLRFSNFRLTPYAVYHDIDGDISGDGTDTFEMDDDLTQGIRIDYYTEDTAFIRFDFTTGGTVGGYISFVRRYD